MKNTKRNLGLLFSILLTLNTIAQERIIKGKVTAFKTIPLNNIQVVSKKTKAETRTDINGNFTVKCADNDVLTFSSDCFQLLKEKIDKKKDSVKVNLFFINSKKNKELAVANGYINRDTLEFAISKLPNPVKDYNRYQNINELITSEFPYVHLADFGFTMGPTSLNSGQAMLIILDGIATDNISVVRPIHVVSVKVLKGSETSYYGVRGANGVIIIETFEKK